MRLSMKRASYATGRSDSDSRNPKVYRRIWLEVEYGDETYLAVTYEMSIETKAARDGKPYSEDYRVLCSEGAKVHKIKNNFTKRRKKK